MTASQGEDAMAWQLRAAGLPEPVLEYRFHPSRRWRFDLAYPAQRIAIEVEGGTFSGGRHSRGSGFEADAVKYAEAAVLGWLVLRVTTAMVNDGRALAYAEAALAARAA